MTAGRQAVLGGFRRIQIQWGDTLQRIASRELGDATQWQRLASINKLTPPYIVSDRAQASAGVLVYGDTLIIPAASGEMSPGKTWAEDVFLRDVSLRGGLVSIVDGDVAVVEGRENLKQALTHRVQTEPGELIFHADYGCRVHEQKGRKNTAVASLLGGAFVRDAVVEDPRIASILSAYVGVDGDAIRIDVKAETISGHPVDVQAKV